MDNNAALEAKERATEYLRNHPNKGKGSIKDAGYDAILKEGGLNNHTYQQMVKEDQKKAYEQKQLDRGAENEAYRQSREDMKAFRESSTPNPGRNVDRSTFYQYQKENNKLEGGEAHQNAVNQLLETGQKFTNLDVEREMGTESSRDQEKLYKSYGGIENYMENHSIGSGNWQSQTPQNEITTMKEADDQQRQYFAERSSFYNDGDWLGKYGQYDWAKDQQQKQQNQQNAFTLNFDNRQKRLQGTAEGRSLGY
tara:strand:+ start:562 stop:1320 length:759 start_codon:yes stop_codon:yes gene_type:complete